MIVKSYTWNLVKIHFGLIFTLIIQSQICACDDHLVVMACAKFWRALIISEVQWITHLTTDHTIPCSISLRLAVWGYVWFLLRCVCINGSVLQRLLICETCYNSIKHKGIFEVLMTSHELWILMYVHNLVRGCLVVMYPTFGTQSQKGFGHANPLSYSRKLTLICFTYHTNEHNYCNFRFEFIQFTSIFDVIMLIFQLYRALDTPVLGHYIKNEYHYHYHLYYFDHHYYYHYHFYYHY